MRKFLLLGTLALALSACHPFRTDTYTFDEYILSRPDSLSSLRLSISLEYPVKGLGEEALAEMTRGILTAAFDLEEDPTTVEETAEHYISGIKDAYVNENPAEVPTPWEDAVNGFFSGRYGPYRSYILDYYTYTGGAHGLTTWTPLVFNTETGEVVSESDFFAPDYAESVSDLLRKHILDRAEEDQIELFDLGSVAVNGAFEPGRDGVTWYFQPYEIAPYAYGVISVTVPWNELKPYLR